MPALDINNLTASYGATRVLDGITLGVGTGEILGLIGPSGSGKSTILRVLVGLLKPTGGRITLDGELVDYSKATDVRRARDRIAIVFQQYNLFQNMTVLGNVTIAPVKINKWPRREVEGEARRCSRASALATNFMRILSSFQADSSSASPSRARLR